MSESQDLREFIREQMLRFDRLAREIERSNRLAREENRAYFEKLRENTEEIIAEGRAGREALFRILDRLDNGGGAATAP